MKKRWIQTLSKKELREHTSMAATARWAKTTPEFRREYAMKLVKARKNNGQT